MVRRRWAVAVLLALTGSTLLVGLSAPHRADAIIRRRTITPEVDTGLPIRTEGRQVSMTGPMACDPGENWEVRANLSQGPARGEGRSEGVCRGDIQEWVVRVAAQGDATRFRSGPARGCAVLRTLKEGAETDRHQWCNDIALATAAAESGGEDDEDEDEGAAAVSWVALAVGVVAVAVAVAALVRPRRS